MALNLKKMDIGAWLDSPEGKASMEKFVKELNFKEGLKKKHVIKVKTLFKNQEEFDSLMEKMVDKHDDVWEEKCYKKGYQPYPQHLLYAIHELAISEGKELVEGIDRLTENWPSVIHEYMGWQFAITHGQGSVLSCYKNKELKIRL